MNNKDTPEELQALTKEIYDSITNPNITEIEKLAAMEMNAISLGLTADKHNMKVRDVWEIVQRLEHTAPYDEPTETKTKEEQIFWDFVAEWDCLQQATL